MGCNIVFKWQGFINVLESFSYKDSLFILAIKKEKKISELILPSDLILLAYMGLLKVMCRE
jgi:hypothetical protein